MALNANETGIIGKGLKNALKIYMDIPPNVNMKKVTTLINAKFFFSGITFYKDNQHSQKHYCENKSFHHNHMLWYDITASDNGSDFAIARQTLERKL